MNGDFELEERMEGGGICGFSGMRLVDANPPIGKWALHGGATPSQV